MITSVTLRLSKSAQLNTSYGAIEEELEAMNIGEVDINSISQAVINIRNSKLPDPDVLGNAGSFFKNPIISEEEFLQLRSEYSDVVSYPADTGVKIAAGWLIDQCGWKGKRIGNAGVHENHALVLANYGNATGDEIYKLSEEILNSVRTKFKITLEREVNVV